MSPVPRRVFSPKWLVPSLGALFLSACSAMPAKPDAPPKPAQPPSLATFVGTWQQGEPCQHRFARMVLRQGDGVIEGEWASYLDGWGLSTGSLRASPDGAYLMLDTCEDAATWGTHPPRYSEFECPDIGFWSGDRGIRVDERTGELLWVSASLRDFARMKRVGDDESSALNCPALEAEG